MKNTNHLFLIGLIPIFFFGCDDPKEKSQDPAPQKFSVAYKAPEFENDDRKEKIAGIADEFHRLIVENAEEKHLPGVAYGVVVDNELVLSSATGFMNLEDKKEASTTSAFRIASMTKSFTAMAILKLRDEGKLSLEDPISKFIPEMSGINYLTKDAPPIDIENLLTMTAGFPEDNPWGDRQLHETNEMLMDLIREGFSFSNAPGYTMEYSNTGYAILGNIISKVSGVSYQSYITKNILLPLGMTETYWEYDSVPEGKLVDGYRWEEDEWKPEPMLHDGSYGAMGGLITTIEDFSRYVSYQLSAWPPRNDEEFGPIKRSSLREMQTPQFTNLYPDATNYSGEECPVMGGYGFGLGISEFCDGLKVVGHGGALPGFGSNYRYFPEFGVGIMAFTNLTYTAPWNLRDLGKLLFETADLQPRSLPISDILAKRKEQVLEMIQTWNEDLEAELVAENFYMDKSREHRMADTKEAFELGGTIDRIEAIEPRNQLRGGFEIKTENGIVNVYFTLSPEQDPKVQALYVSFEE